MIQRLSVALLCFVLSTPCLIGQVKIPTLSPHVQTVHEFGLSKVEFSYNSPSVRARTIFGKNGIIPYGDYWRTGANAATKISFQTDTYVMEKLLPKGDYAILTIPHEQEWTVYWYTYSSSNWSTYKTQKPVASTKVKPTALAGTQESLQIGLEGMTLDNAILYISWVNIKLSLPIRVDIHDKIMKNIKRATAGTTANEYFQSALYLHEANTDLDQALNYIREVTQTPKALFFHHYREALILRDLKRNAEAKRAAMISKKQAKEAGNMDFVRLCDELLETL